MRCVPHKTTGGGDFAEIVWLMETETTHEPHRMIAGHTHKRVRAHTRTHMNIILRSITPNYKDFSNVN